MLTEIQKLEEWINHKKDLVNFKVSFRGLPNKKN